MEKTKDREIFVASPLALPTVVFDGDCGFCRRWAARWEGLTESRALYVPYQREAGRFPEIPRGDFGQAVHLIEPNGRVTRGGHAVFKLLALTGRRWPLALYEDMPALARAGEAAYRLVAGHRNFFNALDLALLGRNTLPVTHHATRRWFLRLLGVVYIFAFLSLWVQIVGLVGSRGILPIAPQLRGLAAGEGGTPYFQMPTLFWINASDGMLLGVCAAGVALAVMLMLRILPIFAAFGAWFCYLSLTIAGQAFLAFQWDALLLEAGFLAIFLAPWQLMPPKDGESTASRIIIWLYRWLLFRLIFLAGLVKLLGQDPNWRNFTALRYHYWTQPLPTWSAWYFNLAPDWFERLSVGFTFYAELIVPLFFFGPRQLRRWAFIFTIAFQLLIMITGNYGFFNLLAIALCLLLLDDTFWPFRRKREPRETQSEVAENSWRGRLARVLETKKNGRAAHATPFQRAPLLWVPWLRIPLAAVLVFVTTVEAVQRIHHGNWIPGWANETAASFASFRSTNSYGLFEQMTTRRPEIIIEGSNDGTAWKPFEFKWKPGDIHRRPAFCTPHMPRLDWQMWFAGLEMEQEELPRWFFPFLRRLLQGSPQVAELMEKSPFGEHPPRYLRATVYFYYFAPRQEAAREGVWWRRYSSGINTGPLTLGPNGELMGSNVRQ